MLTFRAGIIGLYTGYILSKQDKARDVTIIAEYLPGDQSINYTSPWAGANFSSISGDDEAALRYDRVSFQNLDSIFKKFGENAGLERLRTNEYWEKEPDLAKFDSQKQYISDVSNINWPLYASGGRALPGPVARFARSSGL